MEGRFYFMGGLSLDGAGEDAVQQAFPFTGGQRLVDDQRLRRIFTAAAFNHAFVQCVDDFRIESIPVVEARLTRTGRVGCCGRRGKAVGLRGMVFDYRIQKCQGHMQPAFSMMKCDETSRNSRTR